MSSQGVGARVTSRIVAGPISWCARCREHRTRIGLVIKVEGQGEDRESYDSVCSWCFEPMIGSGHGTLLELKTQIRLSDVMDVGSEAATRSRNKTARRRERDCAEDIGGEKTPASGSGVVKGDARNKTWTVDDKFTTGKTYVLTRQVLGKILAQARESGRRGVLRIGVDMAEFAVMAWSDFCETIHSQDD